MSTLRLAARAFAATLALGGASTVFAQSPPVSPADFAAAAAGSDEYEVMVGRLALTESHDGRIRAFAERMVRDHEAALASLRQAALRSGLTPPAPIVGGDQEALLAALQGLRGADFDRTYARQQVLAHRQALATEGGYVRTGSDANLRQVAQSDVAMIEHHLSMAQALQMREGA